MASFVSLIILSIVGLANAASKDKPHSHQGVLEPFNGKHISYSITKEQDKKLVDGHPVVLNERKGKGGRGFVLQDVQAPISICSQKIGDLRNYHKMVPHVRSIDIYEEVKFPNGTTRVGAKFNVGALGMRFGYFIKFTHEPTYNTYTWTLDYKYSSDFDDTVGHWQIMPHPTKNGWSRVLYSTMIKLPTWIPEFIVTFLTNSALVESTTWVKKESEAEFKKATSLKGGETGSSSSSLCYSEDENKLDKDYRRGETYLQKLWRPSKWWLRK